MKKNDLTKSKRFPFGCFLGVFLVTSSLSLSSLLESCPQGKPWATDPSCIRLNALLDIIIRMQTSEMDDNSLWNLCHKLLSIEKIRFYLKIYVHFTT